MTHDDPLLDVVAALPRVDGDTARAERLRARCHARLAPPPQPKRRRRLWQRLVRWSLAVSEPVGQE